MGFFDIFKKFFEFDKDFFTGKLFRDLGSNALDSLFPSFDVPDFSSELGLPKPPSAPQDTLKFLGLPEGLAARQFSQRSSIARQLGLPISDLNIPLF